MPQTPRTDPHERSWAHAVPSRMRIGEVKVYLPHTRYTPGHASPRLCWVFISRPTVNIHLTASGCKDRRYEAPVVRTVTSEKNSGWEAGARSAQTMLAHS